MKIPSRAWGFVRAGLNNSFGVRVAGFGVGGTEDNPLLNDVDAGDEAAGVEFCPVFAAQEASGTLTVRTDGALSFVGAADGTYVIPYSLYTFTPGDSASVDEGDADVTINVGAGATDLAVADATHGHAVDNVVLTTSTTLVVADAVHAHSVDSLALTLQTTLAVADALHDHAADNVVLGVAGATNLTVADATHSHTVDGLTLTAASVLAIQDALHAHAADNITLDASGAIPLLVAEALHAHTSDGVALTVDAWLVVADALHGHAAENVQLDDGGGTATVLTVADALHAHWADKLSLSPLYPVVVLSASPIGHGPAMGRRTASAGRRRPSQLNSRTR